MIGLGSLIKCNTLKLAHPIWSSFSREAISANRMTLADRSCSLLQKFSTTPKIESSL